MSTPSWYYLDPSGQPAGPYLPEGLAGLCSSGHVTKETFCWAEGQDSWKALQDVPELQQAVVQAPAQGQSANVEAVQSTASAAQDFAAATSSTAPVQSSTPQPSVVAQPAKIAAQPKAATAAAPSAAGGDEVDPELAAFAAEITAIDPDALQGTGPARVSTPPPNEQRFTDDDGTVYVWDSKQRKFLPEVEAAAPGRAAQPDYNQEDMTFVADEEQIPAYDPPDPAAENEELEDLAVDPDMGAPAAAATTAPTHSAPAAADPGSNNTTSGWAADGGGASEADRERQPNLGPAASGMAGSKRDAAEAVLEKRREKAKKAKEAAEAAQPKAWFDLKINTSVYVTGLPDDVTEMELAQVFAKCGVLKEDDDRKPKVKVYRDRETQVPKGDGLVTYLKEPSVGLALQILDGSPFRPEMQQKMSVQRAKFEQKGEGYVAKAKPKKKKPSAAVEKKMDRTLGWGGFDDIAKPTEVTVILEHMFTPAEFEEDPTLRQELEDDITAECGKMGKVDKVKLYHTHPDGIVSLKYSTTDAAQQCIKVMDGRFFGGRQVKAHLWDGFSNYHIEKKAESAEEQARRLERFAQELEQG